MRFVMRITSLLFFALVACSSTQAAMDASTDDVATDTKPPRDPNKNCVKPGTKNNEIGIGGYCDPKDQPPDCITNLPDGGTIIAFCSTAGGPSVPDDHWFCTTACAPNDNCGSNAYCACDNGQCGCVPNVCGDPPEAGADSAADSSSDATTD